MRGQLLNFKDVKHIYIQKILSFLMVYVVIILILSPFFM